MTRLLVFDSGLGGLSVVRAIRHRQPDAALTYLADRQGFPYGDWPAAPLAERIVALIGRALTVISVDAVVVACNTATTVALDRLRAAQGRGGGVPIVGTVPGIKPAAAATRTGVIGLLATDGTIGRAYTAMLVRRFAADVEVVPVGCRRLAGIAEDRLRGRPVDHGAVAAELAPLFDRAGPPVDTVVLGCTHYPLLLDTLAAVAPRLAGRPITWIDTGPAIAEQVARVASAAPGDATASARDLVANAFVTGAIDADDHDVFNRFGFARTQRLDFGFA